MNLVVLGDAIDRVTLDSLAGLTSARRIEQIHPAAFRLVGASPVEGLGTECERAALDWAWVPDGRRLSDFRLFVTDMDSTLINIECIDEVADIHGLKEKVAEITEAAMRGEIDFTESLTRRVALLEGLPEHALDEVYENRLGLNPGAERLLQHMNALGIHTVLVSGGFTYFTERLKQRLGFGEAYANELEIANGKLTGRVRGEVVDGAAKAAHLCRIRDAKGFSVDQVIAAGDGANDVPMLSAAGFGVAYHAKPLLRGVADCCIDHVGLDAILALFE